MSWRCWIHGHDIKAIIPISCEDLYLLKDTFKYMKIYRPLEYGCTRCDYKYIVFTGIEYADEAYPIIKKYKWNIGSDIATYW